MPKTIRTAKRKATKPDQEEEPVPGKLSSTSSTE
ncbi:unnamed protein product, partial [Caenorhabditis auriculariae]